MKASNLVALAVLSFSISAFAQQLVIAKPKLISYDWIPGRSIDEMARMMPDIDPCWNEITFETRLRHLTKEDGKNAGILSWRERLNGNFLLSTVHFDTPESPVSEAIRPSDAPIGGLSTGFIRAISIALDEGAEAAHRVVTPITVEAGQAAYEARYTMKNGDELSPLSIGLGVSQQTMTLPWRGKTYRLRAWIDCDAALSQCRITDGHLNPVDGSEQGYKFESEAFKPGLKESCARLP